MNWKELPYSHSWEKTYTSVFNPTTKVTFPQFIAEKILYNREKYIRGFEKFSRGAGWSKDNSGMIRRLVQQCNTICNYFPHVQEDPIVELAFKNAIDKNKIMKVGQYRKTRITKDGKLNITQDEKDVYNAINSEYEKLKKKRDTFKAFHNEPIHKSEQDVQSVSSLTKSKNKGKKSIQALMALEEKLKQNG